MTLLKDWQECVGKTVAMVSHTVHESDRFDIAASVDALVFEDGCVLLLYKAELKTEEPHFSLKRELGLIPPEEHKRLCEIEKAEMLELIRLKAKYEKKF